MKDNCKRCGKVVDETEQVSGFCYSCYDKEALDSLRKKVSNLEFILLVLFSIFIFFIILSILTGLIK